VPALTLPALEKQIAAGRLGPLYLLVGEDTRLIDRVVRDIEATIDPADQPFAVERLFATDAGGGAVDIAAASRAFPMLGDRRVVFVLRAERMLKPKRASKSPAGDGGGDDPGEAAQDLGALEDYLEAPSPSTTLVFVATGIDRSRRFTKRLVAKAAVTTFSGLDGGGRPGEGSGRAAAVEWIREELARVGRQIEPAALQVLVERAGGDISKLRGDVERLLLYTDGQGRISRDDVSEVASVSTEVDDWAVVNAIAEGDLPRALREVGLRFERGDSPHALVGQLRWWVSSRLGDGAAGRVPAAVDALLRTDVALKSSGGEDRVLVERLVVDLTGKPVARSPWGGSRRSGRAGRG
jgi:DNA polymerase-3 subunit delta